MVGLAIAVSSVVSPLLGLGMSTASAATAHSGQCSTSDEKKADYSKADATLLAETNTVTMQRPVYGTSTVGTHPPKTTCTLTNEKISLLASEGSKTTFTGGSTCTNASTDSKKSTTITDTLVLSSTPSGKAETIRATFKPIDTLASGGKSSACAVLPSVNLTVTVKPKVDGGSGVGCTTATTYTVTPGSSSLNEYDCSDGAQPYKTYTDLGDHKTFSIWTGVKTLPNSQPPFCSDGYNATITLDAVPTNSTTSVQGTLQQLANQGKGLCVSNGTATPITVTVQTVDVSSVPSDFQQIALDWATSDCDDASIQTGGPHAYQDCLTGDVKAVGGWVAACTKPDSSTSDIAQCLIDGGKMNPVKGELQALIDNPAQSTNSCNIEQLGWILCPVLNIGANLADGAYDFLANNFLETNPSLVNTDPNATVTSKGDTVKVGTGTYTAWQLMRSFANIAFVITFLIIVFVQLTGSGVANYGVKKLLPRLILVAILVNISFYICQLAIDLSNILGFSFKGLLSGVAKQVADAGTSKQVAGASGGNALGLVTAVVTAGTLVWINLGAVFIAVVGALLVLLTIFVILIVRQALIVLLVVLSPLAFVAYIFPGTEKWFGTWRKTLMSLLLIFPIIGLLYGASQLTSTILSQAAVGSGHPMVMQIAAYFVLIVPLIAVIPLLRGSLNAIGSIGGKINSLGQSLQKSGRNRAQKSYDNSRVGQFRKYQGQQWDNRRRLMQSGAYRAPGGKANPLNWVTAANRGANKLSGRFGARLGASGVAEVEEQEAKDVKAQQTLLQSQITEGKANAAGALEAAIKKNDRAGMKAAQNILFSQGAGGMKQFYETVQATETAGVSERNFEALRENIATNHGQLVKQKAADISTWSQGGRTLAQATRDRDTWINMSAEDLAAQTAHSMERARLAGHLNQVTAAALLGDNRLNKSLNTDQVRQLQLNQTPVNVGGVPTAPSGQANTEESSPPLTVPHESAANTPAPTVESGGSDSSGTPPPNPPPNNFLG